VAKETRVKIYGVNTALCEEGPDLGGNHFRLLELPRIGLFAGPPMDFTSYGSIWHLLDQRSGIRFSSLDINSLNWVDLDKYNLLILPEVWGGPEGYIQNYWETWNRKDKEMDREWWHLHRHRNSFCVFG
jgi:hypothetical protein